MIYEVVGLVGLVCQVGGVLFGLVLFGVVWFGLVWLIDHHRSPTEIIHH